MLKKLIPEDGRAFLKHSLHHDGLMGGTCLGPETPDISAGRYLPHSPTQASRSAVKAGIPCRGLGGQMLGFCLSRAGTLGAPQRGQAFLGEGRASGSSWQSMGGGTEPQMHLQATQCTQPGREVGPFVHKPETSPCTGGCWVWDVPAFGIDRTIW